MAQTRGRMAYDPEQPYYAVAKQGRGWAWVVASYADHYANATAPRASGTTTSYEAAVDAGRAAGGTWENQAGLVAHWRHVQTTHARLAQPAASTGAAALAFVYCGTYDDDGRWLGTGHQIMRQTGSRVYVDVDAYHPEHRRRAEDCHTFTLDRVALERDGYAWSRQRRERYYRERPDEPNACPGTVAPPCLAVLGVAWPCTEAAIRRAYRQLVQMHHPDRGGASAEFIAVQAAYEQALALLRRAS